VVYVKLDDFHPILAVRRIGTADGAAVSEMLMWVDVHMRATDRPLGLVYDAGTNPVGRPDARARHIGGEWLRARQRELVQRCAGIDFAFPSALSRGAITAVFWIATPPVPYRIHGSSLEAVRQSAQRCGLAIDPNKVVAALRAADPFL
jgi:hypothetical protein